MNDADCEYRDDENRVETVDFDDWEAGDCVENCPESSASEFVG
jgi:hypothetical protein